MTTEKFPVGGVLYDRPYKIRRLNHFGISVDDTGKAAAFYRDLLGFAVADTLDLEKYDPGPWLDEVPDKRIYFLRHNSDHHTFVLMPRSWSDHMEEAGPPRPHGQPDHLAGRQPSRGRRGAQVARFARPADRALRPRPWLELAYLLPGPDRPHQRAGVRDRAGRLGRREQAGGDLAVAERPPRPAVQG